MGERKVVSKGRTVTFKSENFGTVTRYFINAKPRFKSWVEIHKHYYIDGQDLILIMENGQVKKSFASRIKRVIFR